MHCKYMEFLKLVDFKLYCIIFCLYWYNAVILRCIYLFTAMIPITSFVPNYTSFWLELHKVLDAADIDLPC